MRELILASSSPWKSKLLQRLGLPFRALAADIDESARDTEDPVETAVRLAREKASKIFADWPEAIVIGSDQVCHTGGRILTKPQTVPRAREQLALLSGRRAHFVSAVCLQAPSLFAQDYQTDEVHFRRLSPEQIDNYLRREPDAAGCAGACRAESLGIALCQKISNEDPSALIGLPLIKLVDLLQRAGFAIP